MIIGDKCLLLYPKFPIYRTGLSVLIFHYLGPKLDSNQTETSVSGRKECSNFPRQEWEEWIVERRTSEWKVGYDDPWTDR